MRQLHIVVLLGLILITITNILYGQSNTEVFRNYSYHVVGVIGNKAQVGGSGFFIRKNSNFYLVSAWHCFSFKDPITQSFENDKSLSTKEIIVYRNLADIRINNYLRIGLFNSETHQPMFSTIYYQDILLDISTIKVNREVTFEFNYYDLDSMQSSIRAETGDSVFYYGFPIRVGKQNDFVEYFAGKITEENIQRKEITIDIMGYTGCSGAPLFFERKNKKYLYGVLFYALKDSSGKASKCKAVDFKVLMNHL